MADASQQDFLICYRHRHRWPHHLAYMRSAKVMLLREIIDTLGLRLEQKRIFDYGFGAGSFFLTCPRSARIFGIELDPLATSEVAKRLAKKGFAEVQLSALDGASWETNELLRNEYDLIVCSHVLEHMEDPLQLLQKLAGCLSSKGCMLVLLPLNERRPDPRHLHCIHPDEVKRWADAARLIIKLQVQSDYATYWFQPVFAWRGMPGRLGAQVISLMLGLAAMIVGRKRWMPLWDRVGPVIRAMPTQLALCLEPRSDNMHL
jgi:SAM-dependent methyltransferase